MSGKWTAKDLPELSGRTAVVTGASSGIGVVIARELARVGARVVLAVRNVDKGERAAAGMPGDTEVRKLDLTSLASVREFAGAWTGNLDILINNAGIMMVPWQRTEDGFESQLATNYLGPFALTNLLLPHITGRIVNTVSLSQLVGRLHLDDLNGDRRRYSSMLAYADSKLALCLATIELRRRLAMAGSPIRVMAAHPGIAQTGLSDHLGTVLRWCAAGFMGLFNDTEHGALPSLYAATADIPGGSFVGPDSFGHTHGYPAVHRPLRAASDLPTLRRLWEVTARLTGIDSFDPVILE
jgi:NAD(P)-dependent dehydrogenase (short-subunit alcohol dehydrogenase family)